MIDPAVLGPVAFELITVRVDDRTKQITSRTESQGKGEDWGPTTPVKGETPVT
jgi:hypothetical protein